MRMRRIVWTVTILAALGTACGTSDAIADAGNCTELTQVWDAGDQTDQEFKDGILARATDLAGDAIARNAETEAIVCALVAGDAGAVDIVERFTEIAPEL